MAPPEVVVSNATTEVRAVDGHVTLRGPFNLEIRSGEFIALLGPVGSGKSTLIRMLAGLLPLASGEIRISGRIMESLQSEIGVIFETPLLMGWRTALENVMLQAEIRGLDRSTSTDQARRLLVMLGLAGYENRKPHELSPSMRVRVALCRALLHSPPLILMDDPFRGLDPLEREQIATDLQRLGLAPRATVLICTGLPSEAVQLSDRVAIMSPDGRVHQYVTIDLPRPRRLDKTTIPQITEYCSAIRTLLHAQGTLY